MKKLLFISISALFYIQSYAADIIVTNDAKTIEAKVEEVSPEHIKYRKANNLTGPLFVMYTKDIKTITYDNGDIQTFETPKWEVINNEPRVLKIKRWFGISAGWVFRDLIEASEVKMTDMSGTILTTTKVVEQTLSNAIQVGLTFSPTFGQKGLGLYTGLYYERSWAMKYMRNTTGTKYGNGVTAIRYPQDFDYRYTWLGVFGDVLFIPLHFQYKRPFNYNLNISISAGPSFEFGLDQMEGVHNGDRINILLGCRFSVQLYGLQLSLITDWGIRPYSSIKYEANVKGFRHRPVALQLSYMF